MIPLVNLAVQYRSIKGEIDEAIARVLQSSQFILGQEVAALEREFAAACGTAYGVGVNSGTSALHLALLAAGVGPGDEVITVPFTFVATVAAIEYTGARPVFVDIEPRSLTIDTAQLPRVISERTRAIIPVHIYGQPTDMDPILETARRHRLVVIEDAAQAHLAEYKGRRVGSIGDLGCFSFYPSKNLGAYGEGGMVVTSNPEYARAVCALRDWGQEHKYHHVRKGYNYRMEALQGAILRVKLLHLPEWTERRRQRARLYNQLLAGEELWLPEEMPGTRHVFYVYSIQSANRDALQAHLATRGVATAIHYPIPVHLQEGYGDLGYKEGDFPIAEQCAGSVLSLPMYPELADDQIREIVDAIRSFAVTTAGGVEGRQG